MGLGSDPERVFSLYGELPPSPRFSGQAAEPIIDETTMKVIELVLEQHAYGWSPEELHFQHPYLNLGQIHSALAYYWDHKDELDRDIERRLENVDQLQRAQEPPPLIDRLNQGLI